MKKLFLVVGLVGLFCANGFGQVFDFNGDPPEALELFGTAEHRDIGGVNGSGYLSITDALNGQSGCAKLGIGDEVLNGAIAIKADLRVGGGTARPADGFSFNFVRPDDLLLDPGCAGYSGTRDLGAGEDNLPEEGSQTGLAIGFDEWFSGGEDVVGISVRVDGEIVEQVEFPTLNGAIDDDTSLQTGEIFPVTVEEIEDDPELLGWAPFTIDLSADNKLQVTYKGREVFEGGPLQIDYERHEGAFVFGGRTGGANAHHHIDNLSVTVGDGGDPCDFNGDGNVDAGDIQDLIGLIRSGGAGADVNGDGTVDGGDLTFFITSDTKLHAWVGDSNNDGEFSSSDFVQVFQDGLFETGNPATYAQGDWNGDGVFSSSDFVAAFQDGGFELGPRWTEGVASVPEPSAIVLAMIGGLFLLSRRRR